MGNTITYTKTPHELDLGHRGKLLGLQFDTKAIRYAGVPYALPPTGQYRWRKPRSLPESYIYADAATGGAYNATRFKPVCPQKTYHVGAAEGADGEDGDGGGGYSEDCLFLNIWTPVPSPTQGKLPVMLWLHGGWFQMGDPSQEPGMDPTELISAGKLNAIVVAIGYRLNVFGFLSGTTVLEDNAGDAGGNFGLWDQRLAAEWVWHNIHFFGGDRENITLAGRSAGAYSVEVQTVYDFSPSPNPGSSEKGLFRRFFMDSNAIPAQPKSLTDAECQFNELCSFFEIQGENKLDKLRQKSAQELLGAIPNLKNHTFRPVTDNSLIRPGLIEYLASEQFAARFRQRGCRLLIGEVRNEETLYSTYNSPTEPTVESLRAQIANYYAPEVTERALKCYTLPESTDLDEWKQCFGRIISDGQVRAPSRALVQNLVRNGVHVNDIWRYQIAYRLSFIDESVAPRSFGVAHAMDKPFWNFSICYGPTPSERRLMEDWIQNLVAFVNDDAEFEFGTRRIEEMKVVSPEGRIEVVVDERWEELLKIGQMFAHT